MKEQSDQSIFELILDDEEQIIESVQEEKKRNF